MGLGNPGSRYARSRHNVGFRVADELARALPPPSWARKFDGELALSSWDGEKVGLLKPLTFMNASGDSVAAAARFFKLDPEEVLVVHDEMDLTLGRLQLRRGGGSAGHNGLRSIAERLGGADFGRLRVGVGRPPPGWDPANWVLSDFGPDEESVLLDLVPRAAEAARAAVTKGLSEAMNAFNRRPG
ncbi:MAG: aminoacyl-tRNA hydrolase [Myxococcales bacterium]